MSAFDEQRLKAIAKPLRTLLSDREHCHTSCGIQEEVPLFEFEFMGNRLLHCAALACKRIKSVL
ncbi:MAG: hypothetical protein WDN28_25220 [Chthoniobacter sp.]